MADVRIHPSIEHIGRSAWDSCFVGATEAYDYLLAVERAALDGFTWRYATVSEDDTVIAAAPAFLTDYALDTTLTGIGKGIVQSIRALSPGALKVRLGAIGSPCTESVSLGFHPRVAPTEKAPILRALMREFEVQALREHCGLLAAKDAPGAHKALWDAALVNLGYRAIPGLPIAALDIDFESIDAYLARLSSATRKDMRRKLRASDGVGVEYRHDVEDVLDDIMVIYSETLARADMQFEQLSPDYFRNVVRLMGNCALVVLYWTHDKLIGFNLLLQNGHTLLDKFFCMELAEGRRNNLYFLSWFTNIQICLERGLTRYQSGQAGYENKLRLGSRLESTAMYFRHRNRLVNSAMHMAAPLFVPDPTFAYAAG